MLGNTWHNIVTQDTPQHVLLKLLQPIMVWIVCMQHQPAATLEKWQHADKRSLVSKLAWDTLSIYVISYSYRTCLSSILFLFLISSKTLRTLTRLQELHRNHEPLSFFYQLYYITYFLQHVIIIYVLWLLMSINSVDLNYISKLNLTLKAHQILHKDFYKSTSNLFNSNPWKTPSYISDQNGNLSTVLVQVYGVLICHTYWSTTLFSFWIFFFYLSNLILVLYWHVFFLYILFEKAKLPHWFLIKYHVNI